LIRTAIRSERRAEWRNLHLHLGLRRSQLGLTQRTLAERTGIRQSEISLIESGKRLPTLSQLAALAEHLAVPLQWFINGRVSADYDPAAIALELQYLGIADLLFNRVTVPGAFREPEQILALALRGDAPDPRIIEAIPYVLNSRPWFPFVQDQRSWNRWLLYAYAQRFDERVLRRLGWLIDIAFLIRFKFPHRVDPESDTALEWVKKQAWQARTQEEDSLGYPSQRPAQLPAVHKRWRITYATTVDAFVERAKRVIGGD
jgi:transcriptional regulator with XRE-family HTH domain